MKKSIFFLILLTLFLVPSTDKAEAVGCPEGLDLFSITTGVACRKVYFPGDTLPPMCREDQKYNFMDIFCHSYMKTNPLLPGQELGMPDQFNVRQSNGAFPAGYGWFKYGNSVVWNGPGPEPSIKPIAEDGSQVCDAVRSLIAGRNVFETRPNNGVGLLDFGDASSRYDFEGAHACNLEWTARQCGLTIPDVVANKVFDPSYLGTSYRTSCQSATDPAGAPSSSSGVGSGNQVPPPSSNQVSPPSTQTLPPVSGAGGPSSYVSGALGIVNTTLDRILNPNRTPANQSQGTSVTINVNKLNVRSASNTTAPVVRQLSSNTTYVLSCYVLGETVDGSNKWWKTVDGNYVWGGGVIESSGGATLCAGAVSDVPVVQAPPSSFVTPPLVSLPNAGPSIDAEPLSTKFTSGQKVQTNSNLNVRGSASVNGTLLGLQNTGSTGTVIGGGLFVGGYYWWNINYDNGVDGWSAESFLNIFSASPPVADSTLPPPPLPKDVPPPGASSVTNSNIGIYFWGGTLDSPGSNIIQAGANLVKNLGVDKIRFALSVKSDKDYSGGVMVSNFSLVNLAKRDDFTSIISDPQFKTIMITAYDGVSLPHEYIPNLLDPAFMSASSNIEKIKNEYRDLANYLKGFSGKTFIISNWEGDNTVYCGSSYDTTAEKCPNHANNIEAFRRWVNAYADGIRLAGASNVFSAVEFNQVNLLKNKGLPSILYDVVPQVNTDYVSYSSYESLDPIISGNGGNTLSTDIDTIISVSGRPLSKIIIGEYGFARGTAEQNKGYLKVATETIQAKGVPNYFVWALLDYPSGFGLVYPSGAKTPAGTYVCEVAGGVNCSQ
ncbi:MAG TPA: hypothetical protein VJH67_02585 [Candidatus Paceibacterota bacterium]